MGEGGTEEEGEVAEGARGVVGREGEGSGEGEVVGWVGAEARGWGAVG